MKKKYSVMGSISVISLYEDAATAESFYVYNLSCVL